MGRARSEHDPSLPPGRTAVRTSRRRRRRRSDRREAVGDSRRPRSRPGAPPRGRMGDLREAPGEHRRLHQGSDPVDQGAQAPSAARNRRQLPDPASVRHLGTGVRQTQAYHPGRRLRARRGASARYRPDGIAGTRRRREAPPLQSVHLHLCSHPPSLRIPGLHGANRRRHRGVRGRLGIFWRNIPRHHPRQHQGDREHPRPARPGDQHHLPGVLPAPGLLHRPRPDPRPAGQGPCRAGRPVHPRRLLRRREAQDAGGCAPSRPGVVSTEYGMHRHTRTQRMPLEHFTAEEKGVLLPAPQDAYEVPLRATPKVHRDQHAMVAKAIYSFPRNFVGKTLEAVATRTTVRFYENRVLVKTHPRKPPGGRSTDPNDFPAEQAALAMRDIDFLRRRAAQHGEAVGDYADAILEGPLPWTRMRRVYALLGLCRRFGFRARPGGVLGCPGRRPGQRQTSGAGPQERPGAAGPCRDKPRDPPGPLPAATLAIRPAHAPRGHEPHDKGDNA